MQMAYFTLYGDFAPTYEAVMTKYFFHGRTEAGRSCTAEFCAFARLFHSASATAEEKHEAFQKAAMAHVAMCKDCGSGKGVDRHLFALRAMATMHGVEMPALFSTQAWAHLNTTLLSTSNCGNPSLRMFGFGPVSPQGFGIGYIYKADAIAFCVTSKHRQTPRYVHTLENYLHDIRELLNADYSFMNGRLARHYGLPGERGEAHQKVQINTPRGGGLISHGSVLLASSTRQRTSPVLRGKWVLEVLLDDAPPPAPPGAGNLPAPGESGSDLSLREQLEVHRRDPACATCHRRMDAIGFAMERFDAVGRYRQGFVDTKGELPDGTEIDGPGELRDLVEKELGFRRSLVTHLMTYALGRGLDSGDIPAISRLSRNLKADSTLQDLIEAIVLTDAFRKREIP